MNKYYLCDNVLICCKKITLNKKQSIIFIDSKTDGSIFSFTIPQNFSKKNIESFLNKKFLKCEQQ